MPSPTKEDKHGRFLGGPCERSAQRERITARKGVMTEARGASPGRAQGARPVSGARQRRYAPLTVYSTFLDAPDPLGLTPAESGSNRDTPDSYDVSQCRLPTFEELCK